MLPLRDFGTKEPESEGREVVLGTLLKLLVKDKLLHSGKVPVNAELRPLVPPFSTPSFLLSPLSPFFLLSLSLSPPSVADASELEQKYLLQRP